LTSVYEFMEKNHMRTDSALSSVKVDLELLNNKIIRTLLDLGLTDDEAKVLLLLNKRGERKVQDIARNVEIPRTHLYIVLQNLQSKGLVFSTLERPAKYRAMPLGNAVDFLIDSYRHKLRTFEKSKEAISRDWSLLQEHEVVKNTEPELIEQNLQIISGEHQIFSKAKNLIMQATKEVNIFVNARNLVKISKEDITEELQLLASEGVAVKILTNLTSCETSLLDEMDRCEIKEMPSHFNDKMYFIIVDRKELLLLNQGKTKESSAMWTNSRSFVDAMSILFTMGWHSAGMSLGESKLHWAGEIVLDSALLTRDQ